MLYLYSRAAVYFIFALYFGVFVWCIQIATRRCISGLRRLLCCPAVHTHARCYVTGTYAFDCLDDDDYFSTGSGGGGADDDDAGSKNSSVESVGGDTDDEGGASSGDDEKRSVFGGSSASSVVSRSHAKDTTAKGKAPGLGHTHARAPRSIADDATVLGGRSLLSRPSHGGGGGGHGHGRGGGASMAGTMTTSGNTRSLTDGGGERRHAQLLLRRGTASAASVGGSVYGGGGGGSGIGGGGGRSAGHYQGGEVTIRDVIIWWPKLCTAAGVKTTDPRVSPSLLWQELRSCIKGSVAAAESSRGHLARDAYIRPSAGGRRAKHRNTDEASRAVLFDMFKEYEKLRRAARKYDEAGFCGNLLRRLLEFGYSGVSISQLYVDETQVRARL